ncbi:uncharacterized protein TRIADDRAFT_57067 [Trichoplax adhaerens]|uniref:Uncharacterized protein n=1 Tax=Trichoplax adhaerens TaxID=10228 RepID=B3S0J0_TRIAD|nr:hypothetical protein TRIADDRAFT_57067 [Trichoplax adhaerens]EDV24017.1 hypothetical protein TRIADDRAFT_57067 [Trichoplax adhaerens]|eukprot:XP_002113543.1 hypothetical protein TRIADDRAFT_57067 [Trichoplax adhaerens]
MSMRYNRAVVLLLLIGVTVMTVNIFELRYLVGQLREQTIKTVNERVGDAVVQEKKKTAPVIEKGYLDHPIKVFERVGYVMKKDFPQKWDVLWSHEYPFTETKVYNMIRQMKPHQKVNKFPGSGFITNKASLATSGFSFTPKAYKIPEDKEKLLRDAKLKPNQLYVQKSNAHRGIFIRKIEEMDLSSKSKKVFVQEYVMDPLLIDGRKFDIGIYTVMTSVSPLRVYVYDEEALLRFCPKDYLPLDVTNTRQYVVADDYTPTWENEDLTLLISSVFQIPSLKKMYSDGQFSHKQSLNAFLRRKGFNYKKLWADINEAIVQVYLNKKAEILATTRRYKSTRNFFEMVRFDFVVDSKMNVWLMEVNMSPNLSSAVHPPNKLLYEQVMYNLLSLIGVASLTPRTVVQSSPDEEIMKICYRDVQVGYDICSGADCSACKSDKCQICLQCRQQHQTEFLYDAFLEHVHRRNFRRVFPRPLTQDKANDDSIDYNTLPNDILMQKWFMLKCKDDASWCN